MTNWHVTVQDQTVDMTAFEVLNILMGKVVDKERPDMETLSNAFAEYLQNNQALANISLTQLISMSVEIGYFYRVFKDQNKVEIEVTSEANNTKSEPAPTS